MSGDYLYHGRVDPLHIGFVFTSAAALVSHSVRLHDCDPAAAHLLGRALGAGLLLLPRLSSQERLNLHWRYGGVLRNLLVDLRGDGRIRGLVNPPRLHGLAEDLDALYGEEGSLHSVTSRNGVLLNSGTTPCPLRDAPADLAYHLSTSEQVETEMNVMIALTHDPEHPVSLCQGLLLQALPGCDLDCFSRVRARLHHPEVRTLLGHPSGADTLFEDLLRALLREEAPGANLHVEAAPTPRWFCTCGPEKFRASLALLGPADRAEILAEGQPIRVRCDFCNRLHTFSPEEARKLWDADAP